jgi:hypothetical protein
MSAMTVLASKEAAMVEGAQQRRDVKDDNIRDNDRI